MLQADCLSNRHPTGRYWGERSPSDRLVRVYLDAGVRARRPAVAGPGHRPPLSVQQEELAEPGEEADPYTLGRGEGRGTEHAPRGPGQENPAADPVAGTRPVDPASRTRPPERGDR
jgi:hypothetical protein